MRPRSWCTARLAQRASLCCSKIGLAHNESRDQAVVDGLLCRHPSITLDVVQHLIKRLAHLLGDSDCNPLARIWDLLSLDADIACWSDSAVAWLIFYTANWNMDASPLECIDLA